MTESEVEDHIYQLLNARLPTEQAEAARALADAGEAVEPALPHLVEAQGWDLVGDAAADTLVEHGARAVPALREGLSHERAAVRWTSARTLGRMGEPARPAIPDLVEAASDPDSSVRWHALEALNAFGPPTSAEEVLLESLDDEAWQVRREAVRGLGPEGLATGDADRLVDRALGDEDEEVRSLAARAVVHARDASPDALARLLEYRDPAVREATAAALVEADPSPWPGALPLLRRALQDPEWKVVEHVATLLGRFGEEAASAVDDLTGLLIHEVPRVQSAAAEALAGIGQPAAVHLADRILTLDVPALKQACGVFRLLGEEAAPALPSLRTLADHQREEIREVASRTLDHLE